MRNAFPSVGSGGPTFAVAASHHLSPVLVTGRESGFGYIHHVLAHYVLKCACVKWPDLLSGLSFFIDAVAGVVGYKANLRREARLRSAMPGTNL